MGKNLDDELAEAAGIDDDGPLSGAEPMSVPQPAEARDEAESEAAPRSAKKNLGLLAVLLTMVAAIVCLFMFGFEEAAIYSMPVDELLAKDDMVGRQTRIDGELVPGSLQKRDKPSCQYRFVIRNNEKTLPIRYDNCVVPDTFRDVPQGGVQVTVEGKLTQDNEFEATSIFAKCASKYNPDYDPTTHEKKGDEQANVEGQPLN